MTARHDLWSISLSQFEERVILIYQFFITFKDLKKTALPYEVNLKGDI